MHGVLTQSPAPLEPGSVVRGYPLSLDQEHQEDQEFKVSQRLSKFKANLSYRRPREVTQTHTYTHKMGTSQGEMSPSYLSVHSPIPWAWVSPSGVGRQGFMSCYEKLQACGEAEVGEASCHYWALRDHHSGNSRESWEAP